MKNPALAIENCAQRAIFLTKLQELSRRAAANFNFESFQRGTLTIILGLSSMVLASDIRARAKTDTSLAEIQK
ncbi:MAG: hypothetical protein AAGA70_19340 [Pseudomonadota bacterium]